MKKLNYLVVFLLTALGCNKERSPMLYNRAITQINTGSFFFPDSLLSNHNALPFEVNLNFMDEGKTETSRLSFLSDPRSRNFVYGQKIIFKDTIVLYSNEYMVNNSGEDASYNQALGFLLLLKDGKISSWTKVFASQQLTHDILISYLVDQYIIPVFIENEGSNLIVESEKATSNYSFTVIEVTKEGTLQFLSEYEGRKIAKRYLSSSQLYKGRF